MGLKNILKSRIRLSWYTRDIRLKYRQIRYVDKKCTNHHAFQAHLKPVLTPKLSLSIFTGGDGGDGVIVVMSTRKTSKSRINGIAVNHRWITATHLSWLLTCFQSVIHCYPIYTAFWPLPIQHHNYNPLHRQRHLLPVLLLSLSLFKHVSSCCCKSSSFIRCCFCRSFWAYTYLGVQFRIVILLPSRFQLQPFYNLQFKNEAKR